MGKVLVERPRVRAGFVQGRTGRRYVKSVRQGIASGEGSPACEGIKRRYRGGHGRMKHFNEHLGPLRRYLDSNVGRPWDKVYSEICKHIDRGNVVQKHILTHLFEYVAVHVELIDGEPHAGGRHRWYVCPKSGLLKRAKVESQKERRERRQSAGMPRLVGWVSASQFVRRGPGGWELVTVKPWPESVGWSLPQPRPPAFDVLFRQVVSQYDGGRLERYYGKRVYAVEVRPLRDAELKDLPVTLPGKLKTPNVVR